MDQGESVYREEIRIRNELLYELDSQVQKWEKENNQELWEDEEIKVVNPVLYELVEAAEEELEEKLSEWGSVIRGAGKRKTSYEYYYAPPCLHPGKTRRELYRFLTESILKMNTGEDVQGVFVLPVGRRDQIKYVNSEDLKQAIAILERACPEDEDSFCVSMKAELDKRSQVSKVKSIKLINSRRR